MAVPLTAMKNNPEQENILAVQNKDCELGTQDYPQFGHSHLVSRYSAWKNSKHVTLHYTVSCRGWKMTFTQRGGNCTQLHNSHFLSLHIAYRWLHFIEQNIYNASHFTTTAAHLGLPALTVEHWGAKKVCQCAITTLIYITRFMDLDMDLWTNVGWLNAFTLT